MKIVKEIAQVYGELTEGWRGTLTEGRGTLTDGWGTLTEGRGTLIGGRGSLTEGQGTWGGEKIEAGNSGGDFLETGKWNTPFISNPDPKLASHILR